jgi:HEAT repeat protein
LAPGPTAADDIGIAAFATLDKVIISDLFNGAISRDDCTIIVLAIRNKNSARKITYHPWTPRSVSFGSKYPYASLSDDKGNAYNQVHFGALTSIPGQHLDPISIYYDKIEMDVLVFQRPVPAATSMFLELPLVHFDSMSQGHIRFKFDLRSMPFPPTGTSRLTSADWTRLELLQLQRHVELEKARRPTEEWLRIAAFGDPTVATEARGVIKFRGEKSIPVLRSGLTDKDARIRRTSVEIFAEIGEPARRYVSEIVTLLGDRDELVLEAAIRAVGLFSSDSRYAIPRLLQLCVSSSPSIRALARSVVATFQPIRQNEIESLKPLLKNANSGNRLEIMRAIQSLKGNCTDLIELLGPYLMDNVPDVRRETAIALMYSSNVDRLKIVPIILPLLRDEDDGVRNVILKSMTTLGKPTADELPIFRDQLRGDSDQLKLFILHSMGQMQTDAESALPSVWPLLASKNRDVRIAAADCIASVGKFDDVLVEVLLRSLSDADATVRERVMFALGKAGRKKKVVEAIFLGMRDSEFQVRAASIEVCKRFRPIFASEDAAGLQGLCKERFPEVRLFAAQGLATLAPEPANALPTLIQLLDDKDPAVRRWATVGIGEHGKTASHAIPNLVANIKSLVGAETAIDALLLQESVAASVKIGQGRKAADAIRFGLKSKSSQIKVETALAAGPIGEDAISLVPDLINLLSDSDAATAASKSLVSIGKVGLPELISAMQSGTDRQRLGAIRVVGEMGRDAKTAIVPLLQLAKASRSSEIRDAAKNALAKIQ